MEFDITAKLGKVNFSPANEIEEIIQNVKTILTTIKGAVVLDRNFGINADILDLPIPVMQAKLSVEIIESIEKYEPRVKVVKVIYDGDGKEGVIYPKVRVKLNGT